VLSGSPVVLEPFVVSARYAAQYRNHWWEFGRGSKGAKGVVKPAGRITPYPDSKTGINDAAAYDQGGNFGRIARIGVLTDAYTKSMRRTPVAGIEARSWIEFFKQKTDASDPDAVWETLQNQLLAQTATASVLRADRLRVLLEEVASIVRGEG
jgi:hypothetical protein